MNRMKTLIAGATSFARERGREDDRRGANNFSRDYSSQKRGPPRRDDYAAKRSRVDDAADSYDPVIRNGEEDPMNGAPTGPMLTFKRFLLNQEDDISDEDAVKKYNEYKIDFKRQQLERFFRAHKEEEWFRQKYNPKTRKRLEIFNDLKKAGNFDGLSLEHKNAEKIIRALDAVVVKLEGGTEEELAAVLAQKIDDESLAELKKEKNEGDSGNVDVGNENSQTELEEGAIEDENDKHSSKVSIHKTSSVFLRNIPPSVTFEELETLCKKSPGFLRLALSDAISERKFYRRGWATFKRDVNIKEICWNLNSVRIRDTDMNGIINRDITRRVRTTNGISGHRQVASNDLKLAVKLVSLYDKRAGLFNAGTESEEEREKDIRMGVDLVGANTNPLLLEIRRSVNISEISPEEEELLGLSTGNEKNGLEEKSLYVRDDKILKALDLVILYLRIVHSVDFYNHGHYANEDAMPNRCGLLHVRGQPPPPSQFGADDNGNILLSNKFVHDFIAGFNTRIEKSLVERVYVSEEEQEKLGKKDGDKEIEAFIQKNSVELAKEKWLCPLSGKKFKGPEFIRKHLQSKHEDKLNEVKDEAVFFNNYIADASRPVDVDIRPSAVSSTSNLRDRERETPANREREDERDRFRPTSYDRSRGGPRNSFGYGRDSGRPGNGRYFEDQPQRQNRPQVSYRDLDAPEDIP
ncbi:unnamed protein product [Caenorhabditis auriculariae]|uniref:Serrate RNA effector molecule homolog n=1 Tax=Caenorhabditis auriculariae TaxID=2777116 RepID=A0A8S1HHX4_9PELO|nr:unnamed protein product [Caenorhabditis auriculariae]